MGATMTSYGALFFSGLTTTCEAWCAACLGSLFLGWLLGTLGYLGYFEKTITALTAIIRGIPAYVHILIGYFVIPALLNIDISAFTAATCALAICSGSYVAQIVKASLIQVGKGQREAAFVLGYSTFETMRRILWPQALQNSMRALLGEIEQLLKSTSLLATIGVMELTRTGMNIVSRELNPIEIYLILAALYLALSLVINLLIALWERKFYVYCR